MKNENIKQIPYHYTYFIKNIAKMFEKDLLYINCFSHSTDIAKMKIPRNMLQT